MRQIGRVKLYTDVPVITYENVIEVLRTAFNEYLPTVAKMETLLEYEAGYQDRIRVKKYRSDIDNHCVDNLANEITEFKTGFIWGNPITFIQRGNKDDTDNTVLDAIAELNRCYEAQDIRKKTQHLARNVEITGLGYTFVDVNTDYQDGDSYFQIESLDPQNAFVVYSSHYVDQRPMLGVITRTNKQNERSFTCFTREMRFEITNAWEHGYRSGEVNPLGMVPIVEWFRDYDRMGCFERQIPEMDNLNLLISDFTNDVDQNTQAIWHGNDVEFPVIEVVDEDGTKREVVKKPSTNDWMLTYTTQDGKQPFVKPLAVEYDYQGMLNNIITRRALILQKCNVPQRNDNSGGSTGIAMDSATGWSAAETSANKQQNIMESCKMEEVRLVLKAIRKSNIPVGNPLNKLTYMDVQPNVKRQKTYELVTKCNAISTLISHGFSIEDAVTVAPLFEDPAQTITRSMNGVRKYQESHVFGQTKEKIKDKIAADYSDQTSNSPVIDK